MTADVSQRRAPSPSPASSAASAQSTSASSHGVWPAFPRSLADGMAVNTQINELNIIRQALYELEVQHGKLRTRYEEEIAHLRAELQVSRSAGPGLGGPGIPADRERDRGERSRDGDRDRDRGGERDAKRLRLTKEHDSPHGRAALPPSSADSPGRPMTAAASTSAHRLPDHSHLPLPPMPVLRSAPASTSTSGLALMPALERDAGREKDADKERDREREDEPFPAWVDGLDVASLPADMKKEGADWFAVCQWNPRIRPRRLESVQLLHTFAHATEQRRLLRAVLRGWALFGEGCNRSAQIFDVKTGRKTSVLVDDVSGPAGDLYIRSVRFSPDGRFLATGAEDRKIRIWDITKGTVAQIFSGHTQEIYSLDFSRDGRRIVSGSGDRTARVWDMDGGPPLVLAVDEPAVALSPDGRHVAAGSLDNVVRIWDADSGVLLERLRGHRDSVYSVVFTPDGRGVISGSLDRTLKHWDVSALAGGGKVKREAGAAPEGRAVCTRDFLGHKDYVLSVAVSHDAQWIVSGSKDRGVQFWDRAGAVHALLQGHKNSVISIDLSPAANLLATGSGDSLARVWSYA
ncbi:Chromatin associated protein [Mycena indigotica]|uniref:Chromatin associated protein n=1 Tax=Mycena indigotica TaxID=2126181 RepID=A0A8H6WKR6_9AGAR|nr:Chromatin associated protein [Mycena indigotica]KAF7316014.1 Chromatin associated protein [Mycena indigotica]